MHNYYLSNKSFLNYFIACNVVFNHKVEDIPTFYEQLNSHSRKHLQYPCYFDLHFSCMTIMYLTIMTAVNTYKQNRERKRDPKEVIL